MIHMKAYIQSVSESSEQRPIR